MHTMQALMQKLRDEQPFILAGYGVEDVIDYNAEGTGLPRADVLEYRLAGGHKFMVRPSGTEPKIKVYLSAVGPSEAAADVPFRRRPQRSRRRRHQRDPGRSRGKDDEGVRF